MHPRRHLPRGGHADARSLRFDSSTTTAPKALDRVLRKRERENALVLIEGIYSLDGDEANIQEFLEVCANHENVSQSSAMTRTALARLVKGGRGIIEKYGLEGQIPVVISTFSKTFGGIGGILLGRRGRGRLHQAQRALVLSSAPRFQCRSWRRPAAILDMLEARRRSHGHVSCTRKSDYMRKGLTEIGFDLGDSNTHIMPIMIRDETKAMFTHVALLENGTLMVPIMYPCRQRGRGTSAPQRHSRPYLRGHRPGARVAWKVCNLVFARGLSLESRAPVNEAGPEVSLRACFRRV